MNLLIISLYKFDYCQQVHFYFLKPPKCVHVLNLYALLNFCHAPPVGFSVIPHALSMHTRPTSLVLQKK